MRDFQADIIHAAQTGKPLPASEFSWSPARHTLFQFCKRAYFIRYYLAQGGWNVHSHELSRSAYLEKYLPSFESWLGISLENAVSEAIRKISALRDPQLRKKTFAVQLVRGLEHAVSQLRVSLENQDFLRDPKLPGLREFYHDRPEFRNLDSLMENIIAYFGNACSELLQSELPDKVANLSFLDFRLDEQFLQLPWSGFPVWLHAGILYFEQDCITMLRFSADTGEHHHDPEIPRMDSALFSRYVRYRWQGRAHRVMEFSFSKDHAEWRQISSEMQMTDTVDASSGEMLSLIGADGKVKIGDFPETAEPDLCKYCPFQFTCTG